MDDLQSEDKWDWDIYIKSKKNNMKGVSVSCFPHVPLSSKWDEIIGEGRVVECRVKHETTDKSGMWFGKVIQISGYMAKIRLIGFTQEVEKQFKQIERWVHLDNLFKIGYSKENSKQLRPPIFTDMKLSELSLNLLDELIGKLTLSPLCDDLLQHNSQCRRFKMGRKVEVLRREKGARQMCMAILKKLQKGRRVHVSFWDDPRGPGQWCHENWEFIKPAGWCKAVGMWESLSAPEYYKNQEPISEKAVLSDPCIGDVYSSHQINIEKDMVFELINPLKEGEIVAGKVRRVLKHGYFQYELISQLTEELNAMAVDQGQFFLHVTARSIFPCGFCKEHNIPFLPPLDSVNAAPTNNGDDDDKENEKDIVFSWGKYFEKTGFSPLPLQKYQELAREKKFRHVFEVGMKLEAQDSQVSNMICPATVIQVVEPFIVKLRYDGWGADFDAFKSWNSTEMFPVGWSRLASLPLSSPFEDYNEDDDTGCSEDSEEEEKVEPRRKRAKGQIKDEPMATNNNNQVKIKDERKAKKQSGRKPKPEKKTKKVVGLKSKVVKTTSSTAASSPEVPNSEPNTETTASGRPKRNAKKPTFFGHIVCL